MLKAQTPRCLRCGLAAILLIVTGCSDNATSRRANENAPAETTAVNAVDRDEAVNANVGEASDDDERAAGDKAKGAETASQTSQEAAKVPVVDLGGLQTLVAEYRGKVVYVDFWATWCAPCIKELPELAALQNKYGKRGLQVIAVSFDEPEIWEKKAVPALKKAGWDGPSVIMQDADAQEAVVDWLGEDWRSELPARFLFDRAGEKAFEITLFSKDKLPPTEEMIEDLLKRAE